MDSVAEKLRKAGETFAFGYFEFPNKSRFFRTANAYARYYESRPLPEYVPGHRLYPCGRVEHPDLAVSPELNLVFSVNKEKLAKIDPSLPLPDNFDELKDMNTVHSVAGFGYCHSLPNYGRILREGFDSYEERVKRLNESDFRDGLIILLAGLREYHAHCVAYLVASCAPDELISALSRVPFKPARNIYEAIVGYNFIYYLDMCDNVGRLDEDLLPFYDDENITDLLREFFINVDSTNGYSASIGPHYNKLTLACLRAVKGLRRPQIELRITDEMPAEIWEAALDSLEAGGTNPSLYNEKAFRKAFGSYMPEINDKDLDRLCGVGCTEMSLGGLCCTGSLDAGFHLPYIFSALLRSGKSFSTFDEFYEAFFEDYRAAVRETLDKLHRFYALRAELRPNPMRTLMIDDCIEKNTDFYNGGARYSWSVVNLAGIVNLVDNMLATRELVFTKKVYSLSEFVDKLDARDELLLSLCKKCKSFGVNDSEADSFTEKLTSELFNEFESYRNYFGGRFLPSSIQFNTCAAAGSFIPATPDGRASGAPLADSISAIGGKDIKGATAMLSSAAKIRQDKMPGTPVLNMKIDKDYLHKALKPLIIGYFNEGGMQVQVSCLSKEDMIDAMSHPENHQSLIVRVGGFSEYFVRLSKELQYQIISRTEYK